MHALIVDNIEGLIGALMYLISRPEERERISANASELVKNQYDWDIIGEVLNQRYREFIV
ncbi:MAG: glycosyltransferase [Halobacteriota archaeon]